MTHLDDSANSSITTISPIALFIAVRYGIDVPLGDLKPLYVSALELARYREDLSEVVLRVLAEEGEAEVALVSSTPWFDHRLPMRPFTAVDEAQFEIIKAAALTTFRQGAATPEQRLALSHHYDISYETLTNWVIRADLMRIDNVDAEAAHLLAEAGIMGVHDLALCKAGQLTKVKQPVYDLVTRMEERLKCFFSDGLDQSLKQILHSSVESFIEKARQVAKEQPPQIVTGTEVVILTTGAGEHASNLRQNGFLKHFWSAMQLIDPHASICQYRNIFSNHAHLNAVSYPQLTEIRSGERRIWIKAVESVKEPSSVTQAMDLQWRMATYRFGRLIHDLLWPRTTPEWRPNLKHIRSAIYIQYVTIFAFLFFTHWNLIWSWSKAGIQEALALVNVWSLQTSTVAATITIGLGIVVVALLALIPGGSQARKTYQRLNDYLNDPEKGFKALPSLPNWLRLLLMLSFVLNPIRYGIGLLVLMLAIQAVLLARDCAWPYRKKAHSDSDLSEYDVYVDEQGKEHIYRKDQRWQKQLFLSPLFYRYLVVLALPVMRVLYWVSYPLRRIPASVPLLGKIGPTIDHFIRNSFDGGLAASGITDLAQAEQIRRAIESDVRFFHQRPDVNNIHVCAHSQSTLITLETLFHHLPASFRGKIKSFLTMSSVLSYYHHVKPVLEGHDVRRFPVIPYPGFAKGFRWLNFWSSYDAKSEFYALDEYQLQQMKPVTRPNQELASTQPQTPRQRTERCSISPTNIKTPGHWFVPTAHNAYWRNMEQVQIPFAHRLMGHPESQEWAHINEKRWQKERQVLPRKQSYSAYLFKSALGTITLHLLFVFFWWIIAQVLNEYISAQPLYQNTISGLSTWLKENGHGNYLALALSQSALTFMPNVIWLLLLILFLLFVSWLRAQYGKSVSDL